MGHTSFVGKLDGVTLGAGAPALAPGFTLDLMAKHSLDFWLTTEDLPDPNNRVTLDSHGNIVLGCTPNNVKAHEMLRQTLQKYLKQQRSCGVHGQGCSGEICSLVNRYPWRGGNVCNQTLSKRTGLITKK